MKHILTLTVFSPMLGIFLISLVPCKFEEGVRAVAFFTSLVTLALSFYLLACFKAGALFLFQEKIPWVPSLNINYHLGVDGVSLLLIVLTALLVPLCAAISWEEIKKQRREFYIVLLACEIGLLGSFAAMDLFLFYVFWEVMLVPMYFLIGIWGSGNRIYVAMKFLLYTLVGSLVMLAGLIYLYLGSGGSFDMASLGFASGFHTKAQIWLFLSFALAFAIKVPMVPFHTWLPDAHTEAPTAGSVLLAGVFLKAGAYGFYRIAMPYFPDAVLFFRPYIFALAVVGIVYGALVSMAQKDLKKLIAYSSVSHLGFVVLGLISLNSEGARGAVLQMLNHGISTAALFLLFGVLYARSHQREISAFGGVAKTMPVFAGLFVFTGLSSLGLPGLNNFAGELLILLGAYKANSVFAVVSVLGVIFAAVYILWALQRVLFGPPKEGVAYKDITLTEAAIVAPLVALMIFIGVYPNFVLGKIQDSTDVFLMKSRQSIVEKGGARSNVVVPEIYRRSEPELILPDESDTETPPETSEETSPEAPAPVVVPENTTNPGTTDDYDPATDYQKEGAFPGTN